MRYLESIWIYSSAPFKGTAVHGVFVCWGQTEQCGCVLYHSKRDVIERSDECGKPPDEQVTGNKISYLSLYNPQHDMIHTRLWTPHTHTHTHMHIGLPLLSSDNNAQIFRSFSSPLSCLCRSPCGCSSSNGVCCGSSRNGHYHPRITGRVLHTLDSHEGSRGRGREPTGGQDFKEHKQGK